MKKVIDGSYAQPGDFIVQKGTKYEVYKILSLEPRGLRVEKVSGYWITTEGLLTFDNAKQFEILGTVKRHASILEWAKKADSRRPYPMGPHTGEPEQNA